MPMSLEKHLVFYGTYHSHPINLAIHMLTVPPILFSTLTLLSLNSPVLPTSLPYPTNLPPNLATLTAFILGILYILLEPVAGSLLAAICFYGTTLANAFTSSNPFDAGRAATGTLAICWAAQLVGNVAFEKHVTGRLGGVVQAVFVAPVYVWFRMLFALGYRSSLRGRVDKAVTKEVERIRAAEKEEVMSMEEKPVENVKATSKEEVIVGEEKDGFVELLHNVDAEY